MTDPDIVIMEDDEDLGQMVLAILSRARHRSVHFATTPPFREFIDQHQPRLIIMDMLLSGADGREICQELKKNDQTRGIKILLMSAHPDAENSCLKAGADSFLQKPFNIEDLRRRVQELLS